jgi:hypothetical protein
VLVAACAEVAEKVRRAVEAAAAELSVTPALADFVELRFAASGPRPLSDAEVSGTAATIVRELTQPRRAAHQNFFALLVVDDDASDTITVTQACAAAPAIASLGVAIKGIARTRSTTGAQPGFPVSVLGAKTGLVERLAEQVFNFCQTVTQSFGNPNSRGISVEELAELAQPGEVETLTQAADEKLPDDLTPGADAAPVRGEADNQLGVADPVSPERSEVTGASAAMVAPVFCAVVGHGTGRWSKARSVLLDLDRHLASESSAPAGLIFNLAIVGIRRASSGPAGKLRRRDVRHPSERHDFFEQLRTLEAEVERALTSLRQRQREVTRPVVLLLAQGAPPADVLSLDVYLRLATQASIIWIMMGGEDALLSALYREHSVVVRDHPEVVDDVFEQVLLTLHRNTVTGGDVRSASREVTCSTG